MLHISVRRTVGYESYVMKKMNSGTGIKYVQRAPHASTVFGNLVQHCSLNSNEHARRAQLDVA